MKKFVCKILLFLALMVVVDATSGKVFEYLRAHAKGGSTANNEYISNRATEDVIIMGSSRATHHYNPDIISNSLGLSCYNCGEEGNGIVLAYGRFKMLTGRYKPRLIIYEVMPGYDYYQQEPNSKYLGYLRPYYNKQGLRELFDDFDDGLSSLKMQSYLYQNNSRLLQNVVDNVITRDNNKGFSVLYGHLDTTRLRIGPEMENKMLLDTLKINYMKKLCKEAKEKGIPFVMAISPVYKNAEKPNVYFEAERICREMSVPLIDYRDYRPISEDPSCFQDKIHMNSKGANAYTFAVVDKLKLLASYSVW